jgi:hypothetical protein
MVIYFFINVLHLLFVAFSIMHIVDEEKSVLDYSQQTIQFFFYFLYLWGNIII